jgi:hypothetical protein
VENEDSSQIWYYSVPAQFNQWWCKLDPKEMEKDLCEKIEEILRQMALTETLTNESKGNKKF